MRKLFKDKKGIGPIGAIMLFTVFVVMWFMWLGGWVADVGATAVAENGLTGIEAFAFENINLCIMIFMILGMMAWMYFGGGS